MKLITVVIVNWNAGGLLRECVASLVRHHSGLIDAVVVVDNASSDGSLVSLEGMGDLPFHLKTIRSDRNTGFGNACNRGSVLAATKYILFLNPDTRVYANSLQAPVELMQAEANSDIGVAGIQLIDEFGAISRSCGRFPSVGMFAAKIIALNRLKFWRHLDMHVSDWSHDTTRDVEHVIGAFYLMRRELFERVGKFDERFFVYLEDLDLSLRVHRSGYRSVYLAEAQAFHAGGGTSRQVKAQRMFYSLRSRLLYGFKHFSANRAWALLFLTMFAEPLTRSALAIFGGRGTDLSNTLRAYGMLFRALPGILRARRVP